MVKNIDWSWLSLCPNQESAWIRSEKSKSVRFAYKKLSLLSLPIWSPAGWCELRNLDYIYKT
jgi:hypothetical protein